MNLLANPSAPSALPPPRPKVSPASRLLAWAFAFFSSVRLVSYLPTLWAIHAQHDASQHSLFTWLTWAGANATMAAWLYEQNQRQFNRAIAVNTVNAAMCLATSALILAYRL